MNHLALEGCWPESRDPSGRGTHRGLLGKHGGQLALPTLQAFSGPRGSPALPGVSEGHPNLSAVLVRPVLHPYPSHRHRVVSHTPQATNRGGPGFEQIASRPAFREESSLRTEVPLIQQLVLQCVALGLGGTLWLPWCGSGRRQTFISSTEQHQAATCFACEQPEAGRTTCRETQTHELKSNWKVVWVPRPLLQFPLRFRSDQSGIPGLVS